MAHNIWLRNSSAHHDDMEKDWFLLRLCAYMYYIIYSFIVIPRHVHWSIKIVNDSWRYILFIIFLPVIASNDLFCITVIYIWYKCDFHLGDQYLIWMSIMQKCLIYMNKYNFFYSLINSMTSSSLDFVQNRRFNFF